MATRLAGLLRSRMNDVTPSHGRPAATSPASAACDGGCRRKALPGASADWVGPGNAQLLPVGSRGFGIPTGKRHLAVGRSGGRARRLPTGVINIRRAPSTTISSDDALAFWLEVDLVAVMCIPWAGWRKDVHSLHTQRDQRSDRTGLVTEGQDQSARAAKSGCRSAAVRVDRQRPIADIARRCSVRQRRYLRP